MKAEDRVKVHCPLPFDHVGNDGYADCICPSEYDNEAQRVLEGCYRCGEPRDASVHNRRLETWDHNFIAHLEEQQ